MEAIRIENLTKRYKDVLAVDGLSLSINEGELFSLLGVNGAGKTTTIKMLSCLTSATDGDAYLLGKSIRREANEVKSLIAVSPQESAIAKALSVRENLSVACEPCERCRREHDCGNEKHYECGNTFASHFHFCFLLLRIILFFVIFKPRYRGAPLLRGKQPCFFLLFTVLLISAYQALIFRR